MKKALIIGISIALIAFFSVPAMMFAEPGDHSNAEGTTPDGQYYMDPLDKDYRDPPECLPKWDDEFLPVYCLDEDIRFDPCGFEYVETNINVSDELIANGEDPNNAVAVEIMATTATGASNKVNQDVVWALITSLTGKEKVEYCDLQDDGKDVYDAVLALAEEYNDLLNDGDPLNDPESIDAFLADKGVNDIYILMNPEGVKFIEPNGTANNEFIAVAIMPAPLVPGITDGGKVDPVAEGEDPTENLPPFEDAKPVFWYILEGSYNVSFCPDKLVTSTIAPMFDYKDDGDGMNGIDNDGDGIIAGDSFGASIVNYYFYWWGDGYPEFEEMNVRLGACVDIDEDKCIDLEKKGGVLCDFNKYANVVKVSYCGDPDGHVIKTCGTIDEGLNEVPAVKTYVPKNKDIDYFDSGKLIMRFKKGQDGKCSAYHDVLIGDRWWCCGYEGDHWVNGAPAVTIPAGFYSFDWYREETKCQAWTWPLCWKCAFTYHPEPYYQRFVIESYSEPCAEASEFYSRWLTFTANKTNSATGQPVADAVYGLTYNNGRTEPNSYPYGTFFMATTQSNGNAVFQNLPWGIYKLQEISAPAGFYIDPNIYWVKVAGKYNGNPDIPIAGGGDEDAWGFINVKDNPIPRPGPGPGPSPTVTVAGTVEVLAFTGLNPVIPISGASVALSGLGLFVASLIRRKKQ